MRRDSGKSTYRQSSTMGGVRMGTRDNDGATEEEEEEEEEGEE